ncbi:aminotransferase class I/II-fold pyridoxal phosphate-dependent enzyme [Nocardia seriolae]|uniref:8-amino-7-oxononanoate synthase n=1 Tax=Nocardia seriolae TaxID=37332 RepID=A0A0B8NLT4_9NOCA|nr:aminotransferase class I/II-fold pyridoxal phosphate-dependent enzyme [Nocardia seriolae]MTJ61434.1 aminotransferase class I/II-fold pyridoxal phosphate-dependent enzyme [Nocardia seriolae]MTJ74782.1 aminotransferase class I/II-fold pyridoxal phosphate-dependent enzyme [Nocardia seriolae]MTJ86465.1 aminotransferase class I/II-fold pyridoxal phosphate-dependent enzyme [Nocardia seriolae]MTK30460.1 aminotransferase class I/II-fold pyridoxal phosphate-dependent enzyme [Nocardia seriolae]MTK394
MTESARDLARKLLAGNGIKEIKQSVATASAAKPARAVRGPGKQFADHPEVAAAVAKRAAIAAIHEQSGMPNPLFLPRDSANDTVIRALDTELVNFSAYNYLGLSSHPQVVRAAQEALDRYGASASASRIVSGEIPLYAELEQRLAGIYEVGDAMVTTSGYLTNAGVIGFLLREGDVAFCDSLIHGSVVSGTQWAGCRRINFRHNDPESLRSVLKMSRSGFDRALVVLEGHYSMDGTVGRVAELAAVAREFDCAVMVDEAHSFGVFGPTGHGIREHYGMAGAEVDIWMGTLSKALGSVGGFIAADADLIGAMKATAPGVAMLTGAPAPSGIAAALAGLEVLEAEPDRVARLWHNARLFDAALRERELNLGDSQGTPILPVIVPGEIQAGFVSSTLLQRGVYAGAISAPAVPVGKERLRFFITSEHTERQLLSTADLLAEAIALSDQLPATIAG